MNVDQKPTRFLSEGGPSLCVVDTSDVGDAINLTQGGNLMMAWWGRNSHDLWWSAYPFTSQSTLPSPTLGSTPSMCIYSTATPETGIASTTQLAWIADDSTTILSANAYATSSTMDSWGTPAPLAPPPAQPQSDNPVGLTANYNGTCAFWKGATSTHLWWINDSTQPAQTKIPGATNVFTGVGAAVQDQVLEWLPTWVFWADDTGAIWWTKTTDGVSWLPPQQGPSANCALTPAVAYFQNQVVVMWNEVYDGAIFYSVMETSNSGYRWSPVGTLSPALSNGSPALAVWNDTLYVAWSGYSDGALWYAALSELPTPAQSPRM
jgi:hypothetical protein